MPLKIAISGSTGLVGSKLVEHFNANAHQVCRIIRKETDLKGPDPRLVMDVSSATIEQEKLEGHDVVINLAGASIAGHPWDAAYKRVLFASRVDTTKFLCASLAKLKHKPKVLLSASAVGFYGALPPTESADERSPLGKDFLAQVCQHWEAATAAAREAGIRVCLMRLGVVLSDQGGALGKMLLPFKMGAGGKLGSGEQMFSWIALDEIPFVVQHLIDHQQISGPVNVVAPYPVSNREFTAHLGKALHRPTVLPMPAFAVKLLFGEMGETCLLNGQKVLPQVLKGSHYQFKYPTIEEGLQAALAP